MFEFFLLAIVGVIVAAYPDKYYGIDVSAPTTTSQFKCLRAANLSFAIVRVFRSNGVVDANAAQTIANAQAAGVRTDGYIFPCPLCSTSAKQQITTLVAALNASQTMIGTLWFDIEQAQLYWHQAVSKNQQFLEDMIGTCNSLGISFGIYSNWVSWPAVFGSSYAYPMRPLPPLWYPHYDGKPVYSDFKPFGGFTAGDIDIKQFSDKGAKCGASYDINWRAVE
jgi:hypothetical protein